MKHRPSSRRHNISNREKKEDLLLSSSSSGSRLLRGSSDRSVAGDDTVPTCSTNQSRSRSPSPQQVTTQRGMDPDGVIVIPRRQPNKSISETKKSAATAIEETAGGSGAVVTFSDKDDNIILSSQHETAIVVADPAAIVTPNNSTILRESTISSNDEYNDDNSDHEIQNETTALTLYTPSKNGKSSDGGQDVAKSKATKTRSSSRSRGGKSSRNNHNHDVHGDEKKKNDEESGRNNKSKRRSLRSRSCDKRRSSKDWDKDAKEKGSAPQSSSTEYKNVRKRGSSLKKKTHQLTSIKGREAIRSFSRTRSISRGRKVDNDDETNDNKEKSWKDGLGSSSPKNKHGFMKKMLSNTFGGKTTATTADKKDDSAAPKSAKGGSNRSSSRGNTRARSRSQPRAASRNVRSKSPPPSRSRDIRRRRPSLSPDRRRPIVSRGRRLHSRSRSPSESPLRRSLSPRRRGGRSLSPSSSHSSRSSFYSRSPSPYRRRSYSPNSYSTYSRSRSPSPYRRRSMSPQSYASGRRSSSSWSRTPSPRHRRGRYASLSPRRRGGADSRSRTPSPRRLRQSGSTRRRTPSPRINRSGSFRSQSPPCERGRKQSPIMRRSSSQMNPRRPSFSPSRREARNMSVQGQRNQHRRLSNGPGRNDTSNRRRGNDGANRYMAPRRSMSQSRIRPGSRSPPLNRRPSGGYRFGRHNSERVPRRRGVPNVSSYRRRDIDDHRDRVASSKLSSSPPRAYRSQSWRRHVSEGYNQRDASTDRFVESQALVIREPQSYSNEQHDLQRRESVTSESTGVWINCPKQECDPCDDELTFSECNFVKEDESYATYDATGGPKTVLSTANSYATYEIQDGRRKALQLPKPVRNQATQVKSRAADLSIKTGTVAGESLTESLTRSKGSQRSNNSKQRIVTKSTNGSLPLALVEKQPPFIPGPPPQKATKPPPPPPRNLSSESLPATHQKALTSNGAAFRRRNSNASSTYTPPAPRMSDPSLDSLQQPIGFEWFEPIQPAATDSRPSSVCPSINTPSQDLFADPTASVAPYSTNNWQQYLVRGNRDNSRSRGSSRTNTPERDTSRGRERRSSSNGRSSREASRERPNKMFGRVPDKLVDNDREVAMVVSNMPFGDQFGDFGVYSGQVNDNGRPNGKGSMKYDNGIFYEGTWTDGCQDEMAVSQYHRVRSGFTSWKGKGKGAVRSGKTMPWNATKTDKINENDKTNVRGMEWADLNGDTGRYTGEVNKNELPHGFGIMKYDFGLIAEGEWVNGVLKEHPLDRIASAAALSSSGHGASAMSVMSSGARSLQPSLLSFRDSLSGNFGGSGHGSMFSGMSPIAMQVQPMMNPMMMMPVPQMLAQLSQQNAMYGGCPPPQQAQMHAPQQMPVQQQKQEVANPPMTEIKLKK